jgi:hypothetical protein
MLLVPVLAVVGQTVKVLPFTTLSSEAEERIRLSQLAGATSSAGFLIRSPARLTVSDTGTSWTFGLVAPDVHVVRNSSLPFSLNDGSLWAGRGWNAAITAGASAQMGPLRLILAPTFVSEQNLAFQVIPYPQNATLPPGSTFPRSVWANPFHPPPESIDLPLRFGDQSRKHADAGQSSLTLDAEGVAVGVGTENLWWGPGIRNAITLSDNAAGFPHAFVQTQRPQHTRFGTFDAQWILGQLHESSFFDRDSANDTRTLSGLAVTWSPRSDSGFTLGVARLVMAAQSNGKLPLGAAFDVLRTAGHADTDTSSAHLVGRDQIFSLFGRWVFPAAGFEAYAEWARFEEPLSFRDLLESPGHSEGYTLGFQWAHPLADKRTFRLQSEASYLEPDPSLRVRPVATTYTSRGVLQGFTNLGKTLGAAIGPGASSQWLAGDVFAPSWRLGAYASRIRWDNGVLFEDIVPFFKRQDVTLSAGLRGSVSWQGTTVFIDFAHAARFNYLFQSYILGPASFGGIDILNNTFSVSLSRAVWPR